MMDINPFNFCVINDSIIGFVGYNKKISSVGLISVNGKITSLNKKYIANNPIIVFPNPSYNGVLNIESMKNPDFDLMIYNSSGEKVLERLNIYSGEIFTELNSGLYFIKVISGNQTYNFKWINY